MIPIALNQLSTTSLISYAHKTCVPSKSRVLLTLAPYASTSIPMPLSLTFSPSLTGGLQSKRSNASVLQGPLSVSTCSNGLTLPSLSGGPMVLTSVSKFKLAVRANRFRGSVLPHSAARPDGFFASLATGPAPALGFASELVPSAFSPEGKFCASHISLVLGIGPSTSFSLLTLLNPLFFALAISCIPASIESSLGLLFFGGF